MTQASGHNARLSERAHGILLGLAVGNLLGIPWEGQSKELIRAARPGGLADIEAIEGYPDDDDLAQALILAQACIDSRGAVDAEDLMERMWEWAETNGLGMGRLTGDVLTAYGG